MPVIATDVWRTKRLVAPGDAAAATGEVSLYIGSVATGGKSESICELELELKEGSVAPPYRLAFRLSGLAMMRMIAQSMAARGWLLCNGHNVGTSALRKPTIRKKSVDGCWPR